MILTDDQFATMIVTAAQNALREWRRLAMFQNIFINGANADGRPGCLYGPPFADQMWPQLLPKVAAMPDNKVIAEAAAKGIGAVFDRWRSGVIVPGLPWYPSFAAFPAAIAPPTPNAPCRLSSLPSAGLPDLINPLALQQAMTAALRGADARAKAIFDKVAQRVVMDFRTFTSTTLITNVLGTGMVPNFQPPLAQAGPVVAGNILPSPGALA